MRLFETMKKIPKDETFEERLNKLMFTDASDTKQKDLANFLGCSRSTIYKFLYGGSTPNTQELRRIALFFNVSSDYLLGLTDPPKAEWTKSYSAFIKTIMGNTNSYREILRSFLSLIKYKYIADNHDNERFKWETSKNSELSLEMSVENERDYLSNPYAPTPETIADFYAHKIGEYVTDILREYIYNGFEIESDIVFAQVEREIASYDCSDSENDYSYAEWLAYQHKFDGE